MSGATDQLPRLLSLVPYLLTRPGARLADVARTFGVAEQQVVRDLELVYMCGLPGYFPGDLIEVDITGSGRITLSNADAIGRPLRLSPDEALPLIVGLRMLADLPGLYDRAAVDSALAKLESAAGSAAASSSAVSRRGGTRRQRPRRARDRRTSAARGTPPAPELLRASPR